MASHPIRLPGFEFRAPEDDGDRKLLSDVESHGWHIVIIPADEHGPGFAFTVGLYLRTLQPEILIMGVPSDASARVLNAIGDYAMEGGEIVAGRRYPRFVDRCDVEFRPIAPRHFREHFGYAIWFYRKWDKVFPTLQCIYPDLEGVFPGEPGHAKRFQELQPVLSE